MTRHGTLIQMARDYQRDGYTLACRNVIATDRALDAIRTSAPPPLSNQDRQREKST